MPVEDAETDTGAHFTGQKRSDPSPDGPAALTLVALTGPMAALPSWGLREVQ